MADKKSDSKNESVLNTPARPMSTTATQPAAQSTEPTPAQKEEAKKARTEEELLKEQEALREELPEEEKKADEERRAAVVGTEPPGDPTGRVTPSKELQDRVARATTPPPSNRPDQQVFPDEPKENDKK